MALVAFFRLVSCLFLHCSSCLGNIIQVRLLYYTDLFGFLLLRNTSCLFYSRLVAFSTLRKLPFLHYASSILRGGCDGFSCFMPYILSGVLDRASSATEIRLSAVFGFRLADGWHLLRDDVPISRAANWREGARRMRQAESVFLHVTKKVR